MFKVDQNFYEGKSQIVDDLRALLSEAETKARDLIDWEKQYADVPELTGLKGILEAVMAASDQVAKEKDDLAALGFGA